MRLQKPVLACITVALGQLLAGSAIAQELDPRTYTNTPIDINFLGLSYGYSSGNVLLDPTLPVEDLDGTSSIGILSYGRSFALAGQNAKIKLAVPYAFGDWQGVVAGTPLERDARGFGDMRAKLEWNFFGAPAMTAAEFADYETQTVAGVSLLVIAPTGEYNSDKALNLGSNRWVARPEIAISRSAGEWSFELATNVWLFGDNSDFFGGVTSEQDPLYVIKGNVIYSFRPGMWLGASVGFGRGGQSAIDGVPQDDEQRNRRYGLAFAYPINPRHGVRLTFVKASNKGGGQEFDALGVSYQYAWGGN